MRAESPLCYSVGFDDGLADSESEAGALLGGASGAARFVSGLGGPVGISGTDPYVFWGLVFL